MSARRKRGGTRGPLIIRTFADAVASAMGVADRFRHGHGVAVTDRGGRVLDLLFFAGDEHTAEDAIEAGVHMTAHHPAARRMLLISVLDDVDLQTPNEFDVDMWWDTVERCAEVGLELWEWIQTSRDLFRSLKMTAESEHAWRFPA